MLYLTIYNIMLAVALGMSGVTARAADDGDIVEFQGDRYVIHVDKMGADSEMTLLDVLNTCPEFMSINGKKIDQNYKLRVDNIDLVMDVETFLANVKACEIDRIQVCSDYTRETSDGDRMGDSYPYGFVEFNTPVFTPDLWLMVGAEMDYENTCYFGRNREQHLVTDFYAQLDYSHGPWVLTMGDRYRMMNYWNRRYDSDDHSLWTHARNNHCYLTSMPTSLPPSRPTSSWVGSVMSLPNSTI